MYGCMYECNAIAMIDGNAKYVRMKVRRMLRGEHDGLVVKREEAFEYYHYFL